jgi:hypothetical protein
MAPGPYHVPQIAVGDSCAAFLQKRPRLLDIQPAVPGKVGIKHPTSPETLARHPLPPLPPLEPALAAAQHSQIPATSLPAPPDPVPAHPYRPPKLHPDERPSSTSLPVRFHLDGRGASVPTAGAPPPRRPACLHIDGRRTSTSTADAPPPRRRASPTVAGPDQDRPPPTQTTGAPSPTARAPARHRSRAPPRRLRSGAKDKIWSHFVFFFVARVTGGSLYMHLGLFSMISKDLFCLYDFWWMFVWI